MWDELLSEDKDKYKRYITNFASLSEIFSQKDDNEEDIVAPIVNSKFQESVFQKSFGGIAEDIGNTSYDVSLVLNDNRKYLIGIKTFGVRTGDQKIAQFKRSSEAERWGETINEIKQNAANLDTKIKADTLNEELYKELAHRIAELRNDRIASSTAQIRGFEVQDASVETVYHVLMPSQKNVPPQIFVGETDYLPIDIDNLTILGSTGSENNHYPQNFRFTDGHHTYKYTHSDSQLHMSFDNQNIILETWDIEYVDDPYELFEKLHLRIQEEQIVVESYSWMIPNADGEVERYSGYNAFNGASKLGLDARESRIRNIKLKYSGEILEEKMVTIIQKLEDILLVSRLSNQDKLERDSIKKDLINIIVELNNEYLLSEIESIIFRPVSEMYIPIPNAKEFHNANSDFFGENIGTFTEGSSSLALNKNDRTFKLKFLTSNETIDAYITQDNGKAIQSIDRQDILGEWILRDVFQLEEREVLTNERLEELGINGVRLTKTIEPEAAIGFEFIWIDIENPPEDAIGWVARN